MSGRMELEVCSIMETITIQTQVAADGKLRLEVPCAVPPGPVEVVLTVTPTNGAPSAKGKPKWSELIGLGKEIWQGVDVEKYLAEMREDREFPRRAYLMTYPKAQDGGGDAVFAIEWA